MNRHSSRNDAHKMDPIDETSVVVLQSSSTSTTTVATGESPCSRSTNTTSSSSDDSQSISLDALQNQLRVLEDAETAHMVSMTQHLQEEVIENSHKPVPSVVFKYILTCMGLCGVLIGIVLGAIIGQHLLNQNQTPRYNTQPDDVLAPNYTQAPSIAPGLDWHYPPTSPSPKPTSDIFDHENSSPPTPTVRTAHPTLAASSNTTLMPTTVANSSGGALNTNETSFFGTSTPSNGISDAGQVDEHMNDTANILP
jgi:hypothetical protein